MLRRSLSDAFYAREHSPWPIDRHVTSFPVRVEAYVSYDSAFYDNDSHHHGHDLPHGRHHGHVNYDYSIHDHPAWVAVFVAEASPGEAGY